MNEPFLFSDLALARRLERAEGYNNARFVATRARLFPDTGAQWIDGRLRYAAERDCDLAMICAHPGSASQRNAERHGFRIAYTRTKWQLATGER